MNLQNLLEKSNIDVAPVGHHHAREGWIQFDCPHCGRGTHKFHMGYNLAGGYCNCWRCGPHSIVNVLVMILDVSVREAFKLVKELPKTDTRFRDLPKTGKYTEPKGVKPMMRCHRDYLRSRGYNPEEIEKLWNVQGIGMAAKLGYRLFIPIKLNDIPISWTTRAITDRATLRYISAKPKEEYINHKSILYGEDYARGAVIVFEGPFDVWRIGPGAVCTLGTSFTREQILRLSRYPVRYVCFDSELAAQQRANKLCDLLSPFNGVTHLVELDTGKDMSEASSKEVKQVRKLLDS